MTVEIKEVSRVLVPRCDSIHAVLGTRCGSPAGHGYRHGNGYLTWSDDQSLKTPRSAPVAGTLEKTIALNIPEALIPISVKPCPTPIPSPSPTSIPTPGAASPFAPVLATLLQCQKDINDCERVLAQTQYRLAELMERLK